MNSNKISSNPPSIEQRKRLEHALQLYSKGDLVSAEYLLAQLLREQIYSPEIFKTLLFILVQKRHLDEAESLALNSLKIFPNAVDLKLLLADIFRMKRNFPQAAYNYQQVLALEPDNALVHLNLSHSLAPLGELDKSIIHCQEAIRIQPSIAEAKMHLAQLLTQKNHLEEAKTLFNELLKDNPRDVNAKYLLANLYKFEGNFEKAKLIYQEIHLQAPLYSQAHFSYAMLNKYQSLQDKHLLQMEDIEKNGNVNEEQKIQLSFSLGKAYEDVKSYSRAFAYLQTGNRLRFERFKYDINSDKHFIASIIKTFNKNAIKSAQIKGNESIKPIFIVGMPRSGTSLVEKILSSHTDVFAGGELEDFFRLGTSSFLNDKTNYLFGALANYPNSIYDNIAERYLSSLNTLSANSRHVTDKLPFNMLMIGLIKLVFPNAVIIHCTRDPIDNCLAIFKKNFTTDNYRFGYNLKTLGQFHLLYQDLMAHWHETFPNTIYDISYEALVENPELEIKSLIEKCDLQWQNQCLNFNKTKSIVKTASDFQVRQPIYKTSVELWKHYEPHLKELISTLSTEN